MSGRDVAVARSAELTTPRYEAMCRAVAECVIVDDVQQIHAQARALEVYAKQAMNVDVERKATAIRLRAERKYGELSKNLPRTAPKERNPDGTGGRSGKVDSSNGVKNQSPHAAALERTGVSPQTAHRWEQLARVPDADFERHLQTDKPTTAGILASSKAVNGSKQMDDGSLWIWGRLRDFERDGFFDRKPEDLFGGMTESMQDDVRRVLPMMIDWLRELEKVAK